MKHLCTFFILAAHAAVCVHEKVPMLVEGAVSEDAILKLWTVAGGLLMLGEITHGSRSRHQSPMNYYLTSVCLSAILNVCLFRLTCTAVGYCFFLHSVASITTSAMHDSSCAHTTRVLAGFTIPFIAMGIILIPLKLEITGLVFFMNHQSKAFHDSSFETAHLWAVAAASLVRAVVVSGHFIASRLY